MYTEELNDFNIDEYKDYLTEDVAENIERPFYRGLVLKEYDAEAPLGYMIWELKNLESGKDVESLIRYFEAFDEDEVEALLSKYKEIISEDNVKTSTIMIPASNESLEMMNILMRQGFDMMLKEGDDVSVRLSEILAMPIFQKGRTRSDNVHELRDMLLRDYRKIIAKLDSLGQRGVCEDLPLLSMEYFDKDISCYYEDKDTVKGILLYHRTPSGKLQLKMMRALSNSQKETSVILMHLLFYSVMSMKDLFDENVSVIVDRHNHAAFLLAEKLFPRGFGRPVYTGSRKEQ